MKSDTKLYCRYILAGVSYGWYTANAALPNSQILAKYNRYTFVSGLEFWITNPTVAILSQCNRWKTSLIGIANHWTTTDSITSITTVSIRAGACVLNMIHFCACSWTTWITVTRVHFYITIVTSMSVGTGAYVIIPWYLLTGSWPTRGWCT